METIKDIFMTFEKDTDLNIEKDWEIIEKKGFGFEVDNPVLVKSIQKEYSLWKNLKLKDYPKSYIKDVMRCGCYTSKNFSGPVDYYQILFDTYKDNKRKQFIYDLYVCAYPKINQESYTPLEIFKDMNVKTKMPEDFIYC